MNFFLLIINSKLIVSFREGGFIKQNSQKEQILELFINTQIILYNLKSIEYNIDDYIKNF